MPVHSFFFHNIEPAPLLAQLHGLCFSKPWDKVEFSSLMKGYGIISQILEQDEVPIGFCLYQTVQDEAEVLTLGIVPTARQQSHGHLLLQQGEKYLSEHHVSRLFLEVSSANTAALTLYKKNNFQKIGLRKNYYIENKKKFDAIIMSKLLYKPYS